MLEKARTGIEGLDELLEGGLPRGRPTLVCGSVGCGKTVLAMETILRGALEHGEPGIFVTFEERPEDLAANFASFGHDLAALQESGDVALLDARLVAGDVVEAGAFSLEGLFVRLEAALERTGARRVAMDTPEALFSSLSDEAALRAEFGRLVSWLKDREVTAVVTAERAEGDLTRWGIEEHVSDCVLLLDHRVAGGISKRRLRVVKYRGSPHGLDEFPFLITDRGLVVIPISSLPLAYAAPDERVSSGIDDLDQMLDGRGFYRGSAILVSGTAGAGKSTLAAAFAAATCRRDERCLYLAFEESPQQIVRNMRSVGIDLGPWLESGALVINAIRPTLFGLEEHLLSILEAVESTAPGGVVIDPFTGFASVGEPLEVKSMLARVVHGLRARGITTLMTNLTQGGAPEMATAARVSSLVDTWIILRRERRGPARVRRLYVAKSRGMPHAEDARDIVVTASGVRLRPAREEEPGDA